MKKIISVLLSCFMAFSLLVPSAYAADNNTFTVTVNEYDVYVASRRAAARSNSSTAAALDTIEEKLTELSELSSDQLSLMGYDDSQISILHGYNGERIETNPALRGVFADLTASFSKVAASNTSLSVKVSWSWSNAPLLAGPAIHDMPAIRWQGTNTSGQPINLSLNTSGCSCTYDYYSRYIGEPEQYMYSGSATVSTNDPYGHAYAKVQLGAGSGANLDYYAKTGQMTIRVDRTGSDVIKEAAFVFGYGHPTITVEPSLSLPASFGIGFSSSVEKMCEVAIRMSSNGTITAY